MLSYQGFSFIPNPCFCPGFICPTNAEWNINFLICQHLFHWLFKQHMPVKPIMIIGKSINPYFFASSAAIFLHHHQANYNSYYLTAPLADHGLQIQVSLFHINPFGKTVSPPLIVFRDVMKLW